MKKKRRKAPKAPLGTTPIPKPWDFPPDIFWINPHGAARSVLGHLTDMRMYPDTFGLPAAPQTKADVQTAFDELFSEGWVRGRWTGDKFTFEMDRPRGLPMGNAYDFVLKFREHGHKVIIDFWLPEYKKYRDEMSVDEFLDRRFPIAWRLNPRRKR